MRELIRNFWFWFSVALILSNWLIRWMDYELLRLRKFRLVTLAKAITDAEAILSARIEAVKILENLTPEQANRIWETIKNRTVQNWWPKDKEKEGGN